MGQAHDSLLVFGEGFELVELAGNAFCICNALGYEGVPDLVECIDGHPLAGAGAECGQNNIEPYIAESGAVKERKERWAYLGVMAVADR